MTYLTRLLLSPCRLAFAAAADVVYDLTPDRPMGLRSTFTFNAPGPNSQKEPLGPQQLAFCDENFGRFQGFKVMREQAERSRGK